MNPLRWTPVLLALTACAGDPDRFDRGHVSAGLQERTGRTIGPGDGSLPPGVKIEDGISEDEAVSLALWNNAGFQEALAELGLKRADLVQAGLLSNPTFSVLFPIGPKQLEMSLKLPLEALWLRPGRMAAAELDCERISSLLVQNGIDLIRDVRFAYADFRLADVRSRVAAEAATVREQVATLMQARLRAGDLSELEAGAARVDALRARADANRLSRELVAIRHRIHTLVGLSQAPHPIVVNDSSTEPGRTQDVPSLLTRALASRPDLRAAEMAIEAAKERASLAEIDFLTLNAGADSNNRGKNGFEVGPALDVPIPIFNQGQANEARAAAEMERAARHQVSLRDRIALEVRESHLAYDAAAETFTAHRDALPILEETTRTAERAEKAGDVPPLIVLESRLRLLDGRLREAEGRAELHRAAAQLERSVGGRLP